MKLTNNTGLPQIYINAVTNSQFAMSAPESFGVTTLLRPPQAVQLGRLHWDEMEEDVVDRLFQLQGTMRHLLLERAAGPGDIVEEFFQLSISPPFPIPVAALLVKCVIDHIDQAGLLTDYKNTSVFNIKEALQYGPDSDWIKQVNMNRWIYEQSRKDFPDMFGHMPRITKMQIIAESRDWRRGEARNDTQNYPRQVETFNIPFMADSEIQKFIYDRVCLHAAARFRNELPPCTDEERWMKPQVFAVMKQGGKRAIKLHKSHDDADKHADELQVSAGVFVKGDKSGQPKETYFVVDRPKEYPRCQDYCSASPYCEQWKRNQAEAAELNTGEI